MPAERVCTLYVGKIPPSVDDETITELLGCCGTIVKWKRSVDLDSRKPKAFGFCDFATGEGVLRALRLLKDVRLEGGELLLKVDQKTQDFLRDYELARNAALAAQKETAVRAHAAQGTTPTIPLISCDEEGDPPVSARLAEVVAEWESTLAPPSDDTSKNASLADQLLSSLAPPGPPQTPPPVVAGNGSSRADTSDALRTAAADTARAADARAEGEKARGVASHEAEAERTRARERDRSDREAIVNEAGRDEEHQARDRDAEYRERERAWERREEEAYRAREREERASRDESRRGERRDDRREDRGREREGRGREDRHRDDRGREERPRDRAETLRRVRREREEDELDRKKEEAELADRARREAEAATAAEAAAAQARAEAARAEAQAAAEAARAAAEAKKAADAEAADEARARAEEDEKVQAAAAAEAWAAKAQLPASAPAASLAGAAAAEMGAEKEAADATEAPSALPTVVACGNGTPKLLVATPAFGRGRGLSLAGGRGRGRAAPPKPALVFNEEHAPKMRPLIPIDYGDVDGDGGPSCSRLAAPMGGEASAPAEPNEKAAASAALGAAGAGAAAAVGVGPTAEELKAMIATIPAKRDELYAADVEWDVAFAHAIPEKKMRPWVGKKMVEFLGEEEVCFSPAQVTAAEPLSQCDVWPSCRKAPAHRPRPPRFTTLVHRLPV